MKFSKVVGIQPPALLIYALAQIMFQDCESNCVYTNAYIQEGTKVVAFENRRNFCC